MSYVGGASQREFVKMFLDWNSPCLHQSIIFLWSSLLLAELTIDNLEHNNDDDEADHDNENDNLEDGHMDSQDVVDSVATDNDVLHAYVRPYNCAPTIERHNHIFV